jgi:gluconate 2-dehydrogenase alpha chain
MSLPSKVPNVLGNTDLGTFDVLIIGSGAGGSTAAWVLTQKGLKVLILEAGDNYFIGLDDPAPDKPIALYANDELKHIYRYFAIPDPLVEPRTFRENETDVRTLVGDVNDLPKTVGGGTVHADMGFPRFQGFDFKMHSLLDDVQGANFADWPISYDELEPFYTQAETVIGVQGNASANPFQSHRSAPYPMPPGVPMYAGLLVADGAQKLGYHPFPYPKGVTSRPYRGRQPCVDCGFCGEYGCPNNAKGSAAVTFLREALLTGNCQLRYNAFVSQLVTDSAKRNIVSVKYLDSEGHPQQAKADRYILAASPIEDARLLFLSDPGGRGLGNSSNQVGRNLMFHLDTTVIGNFAQRLHTHRGRSVTQGMADFRGIPKDPQHPLGGIIEFGEGPKPIREATTYAEFFGGIGAQHKDMMRASLLRDHLMVISMFGEDAPQLLNRVDLDPDVKDAYGFPVARVTYRNHAFELTARGFYAPKMMEVLRAAGAQSTTLAPMDTPSQTRHVMGTLRMGDDPKASVCDASGKFHDLANLFASDGSLFVTASGFNPTLTITALALRVATGIASPKNQEDTISL